MNPSFDQIPTPKTDFELKRMYDGGCPGIVTGDFARTLERENVILRKDITLAVEAAKDFVDKCDRGEARSKRSYAKFKAFLDTSLAQQILNGGKE